MKQRLCEAIVATRVATHKEHLRQHVCVSGSCLRHKITVFSNFVKYMPSDSQVHERDYFGF
jgi:hypothetical protein